jgi:carbonic anhydrase
MTELRFRKAASGILTAMERDDMLASAARHRAAFASETLTPKPTRHVAVLACMDARIDLFRLLGLDIGDAHIIRNAGGRATDDALRSLILSSNSLGTREFAVIHHTGCGLYGVTEEDIATQVEQVSGSRPTLDFHPFDDIVQSVTEDVALVAACRYLPSDAVVWGAIYDVSDGSLTPVGVAQPIAPPTR